MLAVAVVDFRRAKSERLCMRLRALLALAPALWAVEPVVAQQAPVATPLDSGQTVTPVFEGWYKNADGSFSISFGYYNRNMAELVDVPIGAANNISPGNANQGQPTHFHPRRHWGVFAVRVPANFGNKKVVWTLTHRGKTYAIPGHLNPAWEIDALEGEAGSGNTPPAIRTDTFDVPARGPGGAYGSRKRAALGKPMTLHVFSQDDGRADRSIASEGRVNMPVTLTWFLHQGPAAVTFEKAELQATVPEGKATTTATFTQKGDYVLRVRANDASGVAGAGHAQCCWTNAFVRVTVTP
jgi:hypothetical protein